PVRGELDRRGWEWHYLMALCHPELGTLRDASRDGFAAWSADGKMLGTQEGVWDVSRFASIRTFEPVDNTSKGVAWSPDGQKFAWGTQGDSIYIWDRRTNSLDRLTGHESGVWCLDWSPDGSQLASGSIEPTVKIWDVARREVLRTMSVQGN